MVELKDVVSSKSYGRCGIDVPFTDSLGEDLRVGDLVVVVDIRNGYTIQETLSIIVQDVLTRKFEVMGLYGEADTTFIDNRNFRIYKAIPYCDIPIGFKVDGIQYYEYVRQMTKREIEEILGYSIEMLPEEN